MTAKNMQAPQLFRELELLNSGMAQLAQEMVYYEYFDFVKHADFKAAWDFYDYISEWREGKFTIIEGLNNKSYAWLGICIIPALVWLLGGIVYKPFPFILGSIIVFLLVYFPVKNSIKLKQLDNKVCFILNRLIEISANGYSPSTSGISQSKLMFEVNPGRRYKPTIILT